MGGQNNNVSAIEELTLAIEYQSDFAEAYFTRGTTMMELQDYEGAIDSFNKCKNINSSNANKCNEKIQECTDIIEKNLRNEAK